MIKSNIFTRLFKT